MKAADHLDLRPLLRRELGPPALVERLRRFLALADHLGERGDQLLVRGGGLALAPRASMSRSLKAAVIMRSADVRAASRLFIAAFSASLTASRISSLPARALTESRAALNSDAAARFSRHNSIREAPRRRQGSGCTARQR